MQALHAVKAFGGAEPGVLQWVMSKRAHRSNADPMKRARNQAKLEREALPSVQLGSHPWLCPGLQRGVSSIPPSSHPHPRRARGGLGSDLTCACAVLAGSARCVFSAPAESTAGTSPSLPGPEFPVPKVRKGARTSRDMDLVYWRAQSRHIFKAPPARFGCWGILSRTGIFYV